MAFAVSASGVVLSLTLPPVVANDIVRFLIDRLDDDDDELQRMARAETRNPSALTQSGGLRSVERLRAEIIAKRHVIGDLQQLLVLRDLPAEKVVRDAATQGLRALAAPYAEHRSYKTDWRAPKRR